MKPKQQPAQKSAAPVPASLPDLLRLNRNAITVYAALRWMAGAKRQLGTGRKRIRGVCGLCAETITDAMTGLKEAGWIILNYGRKGNHTWYRITFPFDGLLPGKDKIHSREERMDRKNRSQGSEPWEGKNPSPLLERERRLSPSSSPSASSGSAAPGNKVKLEQAAPGRSSKTLGQRYSLADGRVFEKFADGTVREVVTTTK